MAAEEGPKDPSVASFAKGIERKCKLRGKKINKSERMGGTRGRS